MINVITATYNRKEVTRKFIECLNKQTYKDWRLILIDNGDDDTWQMVDEMKKDNLDTQYFGVYNDQKSYWAESMNIAIDIINAWQLESDYILICNDDILFDEKFIEDGIDSLLTGEWLDLKECIVTADKRIFINWKRWEFNEALKYANCCSTRALFMSYESFINLGGFTKWLPQYLSDYAYTHKAWKRNYKIGASPNKFIDQKVEKKKRFIFSKLNPSNPIYFSVFIFLHCPKKYWIKNLIKVWYNGFRKALKN
jgi:GT2 family glycosyltransferase